MRVLTWNLNHRASKRTIPGWIAPTIGGFAPDVVVLTEYVSGADHERFAAELSAQGLGHLLCSVPVPRQNQILVASRTPIVPGALQAPDLHPAVPPNFLHAVTGAMDVFGFRLPAFEGPEIPLKRRVWDWLLESLGTWSHKGVAVLAGDFNTAITDGPDRGGDVMRELVGLGWSHALPDSGVSWRRGSSLRVIDHVFVHGAVGVPSGTFSWGFQDTHPETRTGPVGLPDHAILMADFACA